MILRLPGGEIFAETAVPRRKPSGISTIFHSAGVCVRKEQHEPKLRHAAPNDHQATLISAMAAGLYHRDHNIIAIANEVRWDTKTIAHRTHTD